MHVPWSHWHTDWLLWITCRLVSRLNRFWGYLTLGEHFAPNIKDKAFSCHRSHRGHVKHAHARNHEKLYRTLKENCIKNLYLLAWPFLLVLYACPSDLHTQVCAKNSRSKNTWSEERKKDTLLISWNIQGVRDAWTSVISACRSCSWGLLSCWDVGI